MKNNLELLSPGGNFEKIKTAINYGADAVYTGYKLFGLRSKAGNLDKLELQKAIKFVHKSGKKLYLALNSYIFDRDIDELIEFIKFLNNYPPDALIISDLGVLNIVNEYSSIPIHISTQANITNSYAANLLKQFNVDRVVLARELPIEDIRRFAKSSNVKLEVFVHGSMCMAYSGRCFLSAYMNERSANSGDCTQSCRWKYTLVEEKRKDEPIYVQEHDEGSFIFNSYDMCALPVLDEIIDAGVKSLKIEGRMKSVYYTAVTTAIYRKAIDDILEGRNFKNRLGFYIKELKKVSHRPYSLGFYKNHPMQYLKSSGYERNCSFVGVVEYSQNNKIFIKLRNQIIPGKYELFKKNADVIPIEINELYDMDSNKKTVGNTNEFLYIKSEIFAEKLTILRKCKF